MGEPATVGPGLGAFIAFFCLAIALWLLMRNMSARMRRMAYRERERIAALQAQEAVRQDSSSSNDRARDASSEADDDHGEDRPLASG